MSWPTSPGGNDSSSDEYSRSTSEYFGQLVEVLRRVLGQLVEPPFDAGDVAQHVGEAMLAVGDDEPITNQPRQVPSHVGDVRSDGAADQFVQVILDLRSDGDDLGRRAQGDRRSHRQLPAGSRLPVHRTVRWSTPRRARRPTARQRPRRNRWRWTLAVCGANRAEHQLVAIGEMRLHRSLADGYGKQQQTLDAAAHHPLLQFGRW